MKTVEDSPESTKQGDSNSPKVRTTVKAVDVSTTAMDDYEQTALPSSMQEVTSPEEKPVIAGKTCEDNRTDVHNKHPPTQDDNGKVLMWNSSNEKSSPSLDDVEDTAFTPTHGKERMNGKGGKVPSPEDPNRENQGNCRKHICTLVVQMFVSY